MKSMRDFLKKNERYFFDNVELRLPFIIFLTEANGFFSFKKEDKNIMDLKNLAKFNPFLCGIQPH